MKVYTRMRAFCSSSHSFLDRGILLLNLKKTNNENVLVVCIHFWERIFLFSLSLGAIICIGYKWGILHLVCILIHDVDINFEHYHRTQSLHWIFREYLQRVLALCKCLKHTHSIRTKTERMKKTLSIYVGYF